MRATSRARLQVLGAALLFSTGGAAIKAAAFTSWQVAGLRSGTAALAMLAISPAARRGWSGRAALVGIAYAVTLTLFVLSNKLTTAANTIFLQATSPLYLLLLAPLVLREPITTRDLLFMLAFGAGLGLFFVGRQERFATAPNPALGNLLAATCGLTWAITVMGLRWMAKRGASPEAAVVSGNVTVFLATLPLALPYGSHSVADWGIILYLGVFQIALAYVLLTAAVAHLPAFEVTLLLFLEPALNPVWSWLVHGEHPGSWALVGGVVILGATATQTMIARRREAAT